MINAVAQEEIEAGDELELTFIAETWQPDGGVFPVKVEARRARDDE